MSGQTRQNAPLVKPETSQAPAPETAFKQSRGNAAMQERLQNAAPGNSAAAPAVIGPPMPLQYNPGKLSLVHGVSERVAEWRRLHLKDGATLTDAEHLVLVAHVLTSGGRPPDEVANIISNVFFNSNGNERGADNLRKNSVHLVYANPGTAAVLDLRSPLPGTARVVFSNGASSSFTGPRAYAGLDTNDREANVGIARDSYRVNGRRASFGVTQSMINDRRSELQAAFLAHDSSRPVRSKQGTPEFQGAFTDFIYDHVLSGWVQKVAAQNVALLKAWVQANPAPVPVTSAWAQDLGAQAMAMILQYNNPNIFAKAHTTWYVEDEAAAQLLVESVSPGVSVNFDVDAQAVTRS